MSRSYDTPPKNRASLEQRLRNIVGGEGDVFNRLRQEISFAVVAAALTAPRHEDGLPLFVIKGGVAMELRLGLKARATKDLDATFRASAEDMADELRDALVDDYAGFSFEIRGIDSIKETSAIRAAVKVRYVGSDWGTVQVESAPAEGEAGQHVDWVEPFDIARLGLEGPDRLPVVAIGYLIAQKLHACTDHSATEWKNDRFRDLIDIILVWELIGENDAPGVKAACQEIFDLRNKHPWPPQIAVLEQWPDQYAAMADQMGFEIRDVHEAAATVEQIITLIAAARE